MSARKPERAVRAKCIAMTDEDLKQLDRELKREIPRAQSLHSAVRREQKRRRQKARRAA
jgi:hypothetical protein